MPEKILLSNIGSRIFVTKFHEVLYEMLNHEIDTAPSQILGNYWRSHGGPDMDFSVIEAVKREEDG